MLIQLIFLISVRSFLYLNTKFHGARLLTLFLVCCGTVKTLLDACTVGIKTK